MLNGDHMTIINPTLHKDTELVNVINGAIRMQIHAHGNVTPNFIGSLTKRIVAGIEGIVHNSMVTHMTMNIDTQRYVVIERKEYETLKARDLRQQIKYLSDRLKLVDPTFTKDAQ
jgi:hypothetical protein